MFSENNRIFLFENDVLPISHDLDKLILLIRHHYGDAAADIFENSFLLDDGNKEKLREYSADLVKLNRSESSKMGKC